MALFQASVLKKYLSQQDTDQVQKSYKKYTKYFHNPAIQENIRNSKEEQFQEGFLRELFVEIFGYTLNPAPKFNLTTEFKNLKGAKKADGAILKDGKAIGVIELKGTDTKDLESIRQQAFDYKANHVGCSYVITSNFEKLRFYINDAVEYEEFNLFTLNAKQFELLYLCLAKENIQSNKPLTIKETSILEEKEITNRLYGDYSLFKRELFRDLVKQNQNNVLFRDLGDKNFKLTLFKKSQKLLDRFLFILFAEDRGLLAPNTITTINNEWKALKELDVEMPLYDRYKQYFSFLDTGRKGTDKKEEVFAYNGGLFQPDAILDAIIIDDELLYRHTKHLTTYHFESQVDVNILGHIFEHSLNEIESINAEIEGTDFDKQKTKRKKDGVFYTPKYITKYIVDNTIGKLCTEKKQEIGIVDEEYAKGRKNRHEATIKKLDQQLKDYREWLLELTICDPACGSGAFLNQALDFLIKEHNYLDELNKQLFGGFFVFPDIENQILEHNIYGVDLNDESVEIAKLSLWLRTAQPKRKLTSLNNNIKCGNSLIENKTIAGEKAFNWKEQFPEVFAKGGFDVIIGNPPYVVYIKSIFGDETLKYVNQRFQFSEYNPNTYALFSDLGLNMILKKGGYLGFIIPNSWLDGQYFSKMRKGVYHKNVNEIVYLKDTVFAEVVETVILLSENVANKNETIKLSSDVINNTFEKVQFDKDKFIFGYNPFITKSEPFLEKLETKFDQLGKNAIVYRGVETRDNSKWLSETKQSEFHIPILLGRDVNKYQYNHSGTYLNFIKKEMKSNANENMYLQPKILMRRTGATIIATIETEMYFALKNLYLIIPKNTNEIYSMIAQINSRLMSYYHKTKSSDENKAFAQFKGIYIEGFPYVKSESSEFKILVNDILNRTNDFNKLLTKLTNYFSGQYKLEKLTKKLENWHELNFSEFIAELNKAIKATGQPQLTKKDEFDWIELFEENKAKAQNLKSQIETIENKIDKMVYELYGLSEEEIEIIKNS
ncbi:Eco57I restriction-modification methylase domain-containing protein [Flavobacterium sp.]|uniref:Eco57I restriction-modification methylase domain-containing protein n=1 Tax=Flavobacterium sp. TaxID=239 RepID=UPI00286E4F46|nr:TaqI-like C-terminal specificity domain-containing protein [Flavobacterium sp.]